MIEFASGQVYWGILFLLLLTVISLANGSILVSLKVFINTPRSAIICMGAGLTPIILGIWMIFFSFTPTFEGKQYVALFVPLIVAIIILVRTRFLQEIIFYFANEIIRFFKDNMSPFFPADTKKRNWYFLILIIGVVLIVAYFKLSFFTVHSYMIHNDAAFYLSESLLFVRNGISYVDIATYKDVANGILNGSIHNFLWPGYISYGMICTSPGQFGSQYDMAALFSIRATLFFMLATAAGLCILVTRKCKGIIVMLLVLLPLIPSSFSVIYAYTRDNFAVVPLLLSIFLMYVFLEKQYSNRVPFFLLAGLIGFFVPSGHPINVFFFFPIAVVGILFFVARKIRCQKKHKQDFVDVFLFILSTLLGFFVGAYNIIYAYIKTGTLSGECSLYFENVVRGTLIEENVINTMADTMSVDSTLIEKVMLIFEKDKYHLIVFCFAISVAFVLLRIIMSNKKPHGNLKVVLPCLFVGLILSLLILGNIIWGEFTYADWLIRNYRYSYFFYILAIVVISVILAQISSLFNNGSFVILIALCIIMIISIPNFNGEDERISSGKAHYDKTGALIPLLERDLAADDRIIIDDSCYTYLTDVQHIVLISYYCQDLFYANSDSDVEKFFLENRVGGIYLWKRLISNYWSNAYFYDYLNRSNFVRIIDESESAITYSIDLDNMALEGPGNGNNQ